MSSVVLFDVSRRGVSGAVLDLAPANRRGARPEIRRQVGREIFPIAADAKLLPRVARELETVAAALRSTTDAAPVAMGVFLAPDFHASRTVKFTHRSVTPFSCSAGSLAELATRALADFQAEARQLEILESSVLDLMLNGYPAESFSGTTATEADFWHYGSAAPRATLDLLRQAIRNAWPRPWPAFYSSTLSLFRGLETLDHLSPNALLITCRPEGLELALLREGVLRRTVALPGGDDWLTARLEQLSGVGREGVLSALRLYREGNLTDREARRLINWLAAMAGDWLGGINRWLAAEAGFGPGPDEVWLLGDGLAAELGGGWLAAGAPAVGWPARSVRRLEKTAVGVSDPWLVKIAFYDKIVLNSNH